MKKYEIMFIVKSTLDEATIKSVAENMKNVITAKGGKVENTKEMGQRELAYEINKHKNGYYFLFNVECNSEAIAEFSRVANVSEDIIRHLIVNIEK